jgi:hypothetical protein
VSRIFKYMYTHFEITIGFETRLTTFSIQPPGAWHAVYTPNKGMTSGGHLIMYDTLHIMEQIRAYDASVDKNNIRRGSYSTNETHTVDRQLIRMMLAMPDLVRTRGMHPSIQQLIINANSRLCSAQNFVAVQSSRTLSWSMV